MTPTLSAAEIESLLQPYLREPGQPIDKPPGESVTAALVEQLSTYLDLILRWNQRTNLTSIRDPREIVRRHFGESLFAARHLPGTGSLLDFGSGAGFPGVPIQMWHPNLLVTLAESQGKKSTFLREVVRVLALPCEVWAGRVEAMGTSARFDRVVMRAVDDPGRALEAAFRLTRSEVWLLGSTASLGVLPADVEVMSRAALYNSDDSHLFQLRRSLFHVEQGSLHSQ